MTSRQLVPPIAFDNKVALTDDFVIVEKHPNKSKIFGDPDNIGE